MYHPQLLPHHVLYGLGCSFGPMLTTAVFWPFPCRQRLLVSSETGRRSYLTVPLQQLQQVGVSSLHANKKTDWVKSHACMLLLPRLCPRAVSQLVGCFLQTRSWLRLHNLCLLLQLFQVQFLRPTLWHSLLIIWLSACFPLVMFSQNITSEV